jgi:hypothetical protein
MISKALQMNPLVDSNTKENPLGYPSPLQQKQMRLFFHAASMPNTPPKVHHFVGTINLEFAVPESKRSNSNVAILIKRLMASVKQTHPDFRIEPSNGSAQ